VYGVRLNPGKDENAFRKDLTIDSTMLAFVSPRNRRNCTYKGQGRLQQSQDRGGEMEEGKRLSTYHDQLDRSGAQLRRTRPKISDRAGGGGRSKREKHMQGWLPTRCAKYEASMTYSAV
jgi:hypothetical protein